MATDEAIERRLGEDPEDEDVKERLEREHGELLEELRALIPGAQVMFGFLLAICFTGQFKELSAAQRYVYYGTLVSTAVSLVLLLAPSAYHRLRFREGDKNVMVRKGNREAIEVRAPSPWPSLASCTSSPTWSSYPSCDRCSARLLRADRVALVGDRALPPGPRAGRGQAGPTPPRLTRTALDVDT